jgi:hypothetical protein
MRRLLDPTPRWLHQLMRSGETAARKRSRAARPSPARGLRQGKPLIRDAVLDRPQIVCGHS